MFRSFESCQLEALRMLYVPIAMSGRKPVEKSEGCFQDEELIESGSR